MQICPFPLYWNRHFVLEYLELSSFSPSSREIWMGWIWSWSKWLAYGHIMGRMGCLTHTRSRFFVTWICSSGVADGLKKPKTRQKHRASVVLCRLFVAQIVCRFTQGTRQIFQEKKNRDRSFLIIWRRPCGFKVDTHWTTGVGLIISVPGVHALLH